jgi:lipopolysaccharide/colanic/teichoic acid biosynthesis glycosyltransferase
MQVQADRHEHIPTVLGTGETLVMPDRPQAMTPVGLTAKHSVDFLLALVGVLSLAPLLLVVAILIKLDSPGPVFFRQRRAARGGGLFEIFKFRTMVDGAYRMGSRLTVKRDPRITRLGRLLRWSKIDELPQLFNVLRGDMSLIGPRPEDPYFVEFYSAEQRRVLAMRPGIVGPSQIQGRDEVEDYPEGLRDTERYYVEHILPAKLKRDLEYVAAATFWGDMWLLAHGMWITLRGLFKTKYLWERRRRIALMGVDVVLVAAAYLLALVIRFDWQMPKAAYFGQALAIVVLVRPPLLAYFGSYHVILSHFGLWDLFAIFKAVSLGSIVVAGLTYFGGAQGHPRSVFVIDWALLLFLLASSRYALRAWTRRHPRRRTRSRQKAIVVGAGIGGEHIGRALLDDPTSQYEPVGFIDESYERWGSRIHGVKVLGGTSELKLALSANGVNAVFVCLSDLEEDTAREVARICSDARVECRMLPALTDLLNTDSFALERTDLRSAAVNGGELPS